MTEQHPDYRHLLTPQQQRMSDKALAATLPPGQALSVLRIACWDVCLRSDGTWIVTDSSGGVAKPVKVYEAKTKAQAVAWARLNATMLDALVHQKPTWPWE